MTTAMEPLGPGEWDMTVQWVEPERCRPNLENPNEQDDATFNALVASIRADGWTQPVQVVEMDDGDYEIVAGEHRWRAARVLQCKVPVLPLRREQFEADRRDMNLVKDNILHGRLNPEKFTRLYDRLKQSYDDEVLQALMGFTSADAFQRLYKDVVRNLPPDLARALEASKDEIKTIDDLSAVLNRLFREFGETLPSNMMVFSWGSREVMWIRCDGALWKQVKAMADEVAEIGGDMNLAMSDVIARGLSVPATA